MPGRFSNPFKRSRILYTLLPKENRADVRRIVRALAISRLFLSLCALVLSLFDSGRALASPAAFFLAYALYSLIVFIALEWRRDLGIRLRAGLRLLDITALAILVLLTGGSNGALYVFALFVLIGTACHWGMRETVASGILMGALIFLGNAAHNTYLHHVSTAWDSAYLLNSLAPFAYILAAGLMIGFGAEEIKELHAEQVAIARVLGSAQMNAGFSPTLSRVCAELLGIFGARKILVAAHERTGGTIHLIEAEPYGLGESALRFAQADEDQCGHFLFPAPGVTWALETQGPMQGSDYRALVLDADNWRVRKAPLQLPAGFLAVQPCKFLAVHSFDSGPEWNVRIFLLDPDPVLSSKAGLFLLFRLSSEIWPAVFKVYLARKSLRKAALAERASLARELHDGVIQSLVAIDMKLQSVRNRYDGNGNGPELGRRLEIIQEYLRREVRGLRGLMKRLRSPKLGSRECVRAIRLAAAQFQEDFGIAVRFESGVDEVTLPPRICGEILRIVQEALVNVRKHSTAESVEILLRRDQQGYALEIRDDGEGFDFSGRLSLRDLEAQGKGPAILKERVRLIAGELAIESTPGQGTRLEITIPRVSNER